MFYSFNKMWFEFEIKVYDLVMVLKLLNNIFLKYKNLFLN